MARGWTRPCRRRGRPSQPTKGTRRRNVLLYKGPPRPGGPAPPPRPSPRTRPWTPCTNLHLENIMKQREATISRSGMTDDFGPPRLPHPSSLPGPQARPAQRPANGPPLPSPLMTQRGPTGFSLTSARAGGGGGPFVTFYAEWRFKKGWTTRQVVLIRIIRLF